MIKRFIEDKSINGRHEKISQKQQNTFKFNSGRCLSDPRQVSRPHYL